ncbi:hypothetical protein CCMA1212_003103 [Trichoderma ghanense]|uniref:Uncharacterized protein n=1 Tax=Trichoderma ghanense TaxID=65468 RepID=A0ABY2H996_9HYPO
MGLEVEPSHRLALPPQASRQHTQAYSLVLLGSRSTSGGQLSKVCPTRTCNNGDTSATGKPGEGVGANVAHTDGSHHSVCRPVAPPIPSVTYMDAATNQRSDEHQATVCRANTRVLTQEPVIGSLAARNGEILCVFGGYKTGTMRAKADAIFGKGRRSGRRRKTALGSATSRLGIIWPPSRHDIAGLALALAFSSKHALTWKISANQNPREASPPPATFFAC